MRVSGTKMSGEGNDSGKEEEVEINGEDVRRLVDRKSGENRGRRGRK